VTQQPPRPSPTSTATKLYGDYQSANSSNSSLGHQVEVEPSDAPSAPSTPSASYPPQGFDRNQPDQSDDLDQLSELDLLEPHLSTRLRSRETAGGLTGWRGVAIGVGIGVLVAGIGSRVLQPSSQPKTEPAAIAVPSQTVTVAQAKQQRVTRYLEATGSVAAFDLLPILPQANGLQIVEVLVDEGDYVEAGQVLARLDRAELDAALAGAQAQAVSGMAGISRAQADAGQAIASVQQAEADLARTRTGVAQAQANFERAQATVAQMQARLAQAEREYDRYRQLAEDGAISQQAADFRYTDVLTAQEDYNKAIEEVAVAQANIDAAQAEVSSAEAKLASSRSAVGAADANVDTAIANLDSAQASVQQVATRADQTVVVAPAAGIIAERNARVGDVKSSMSSQALFRIIADGRLEVQVKVPETQLSQVRPGAIVKLTSDADKRIDLRGEVREIAPLVDEKTREATVKVDIPPSQRLRPGMFLSASIAIGEKPGITIPAKAVLPQPDGSAIVYILNSDNTVTAKPVKLGALTSTSAGSYFEILSGLAAEETVVVEGASYVKTGDTVRVAQP